MTSEDVLVKDPHACGELLRTLFYFFLFFLIDILFGIFNAGNYLLKVAQKKSFHSQSLSLSVCDVCVMCASPHPRVFMYIIGFELRFLCLHCKHCTDSYLSMLLFVYD